jgi:non-specific serine/threonine protein kinase
VAKLERAAVLAREIGDSWGEGYAQMMLGLCHADDGDVSRTWACCTVALATPSLGPLLAVPLLAMADATVGPDPSRGARLLGAAEGHFERTSTVTPPFLTERRLRVRQRAEHVIGAAATRRLWTAGHRMTFAEATTFATDATVAQPAASLAVSSREAEVARLVAHGRNNREIADALSVSVRTVESHLSHIFTKLGLRNRTEIAAWVKANLRDL